MNAQNESKARPTVILVHGMWSTPASLKDLRAHFEKSGHTVVAPALPYHRPKDQMREADCVGLKKSGIGTYVAAIRDVVKSLDVPPILIGHSMGALIAQLVAQKEKLDRLILLSSAPPAGINAWTWSVIRTFGHNLFKFPMWKSLTDLKPGSIRYGIANTQSRPVQDDIYRLSTYESGLASFQIGMWFLFNRPATRIDTRKINCPVLIMSGQEDRITPIRIQRKLAELYGDRAELVELPGVCHWTIGGHAFEKITGILNQWLDHSAAASHSVDAA